MSKIFIFLFFTLIIVFAGKTQEKRIALVIGNSDYIHVSSLKNPVNDAELMKSSLASLGFEVMMANNLKTQRQFLDTIRSFQRKSASYNVRFVYYAGHAVQIGEENYLLPTEERYQNATDFKDYALPLGLITKEFTAYEKVANVINVVILDACRDNPYKNVESRGVVIESLYKERSSNEVLIAYATTSGATAADGLKDGKNSIFCSSLAKHMMLPDVPFEEVLKRVSIDVKKSLNQKPEYLNSLDQTLYLKKSSHIDQIIKIDSLIEDGDYNQAEIKLEVLLAKAPDYKLALLRSGRVGYNTMNKKYDGSHLFKADSLYPNDPEVYEYLGRYYSTIGEIEKAIKSMNEAIDLDSQDPDLFYWRARFFEDNKEIIKAEIDYTQSLVLDSTVVRFLNRATFYERINNYEQAIDDHTKAISMEKENPELYDQRANCYIEMEDFTAALKDLDKAIKLAQDNPYYYNNRADFYKNYKNETKLALKDYEIAIQISNNDFETARALNNRATIYESQHKFDLAIEEYSKAIEIYINEPLLYSNRASNFLMQQKYELALADYSQAISIDKENPRWYDERANCYIAKEDFSAALNDLDKAIELAQDNPYYYTNRADFYREQEKYELSLKDYATALELSNDPNESSRGLNNRATIYEEQEKLDLAAEEYTKAIEKSPNDPLYYSNRASIYQKQEKYELALADYSHAISIDKENPRWYDERANCYIAKEDFSAALNDLDKAIDLAQDNPYYYNNRADFYQDYRQDYNLALKDYATAIKISTDTYESIRAFNNRALIFQDQEKYDLALEEYNKAIDKSPEYPLIYSNRAEIYQKQQNYKLALTDYTKAIELDPLNFEGYAARASFYQDILKKPYDALVDYSLAISLDSGNVYCWFMRGLLFSNVLNDHKSAIRDFQTVLRIDSNDVTALNWLGVLNGRIGNDSLELYFYNQIIKKEGFVSGDSAEFVSTLGWAYNNIAYSFQKQNNNSESIKYYNRAVGLDSTEVLRYYERAWFYTLYMNNYDSAIADIDRALEIDVINPYYYLQRAKIHLIADHLNEAKKDFSKAIELSNNSERYIVELANYFSILGDNKNAEKNFENALINDSLNSYYLHFKTNHLMRNKLWPEATENALKVLKYNVKDTMSYFQLGNIYFVTNQYQKALNSLLMAENIILLSEHQKEIDESDESQIFLSDIQYEILNIYLILGERELACSYLKKALSSLEFETRSKKEVLYKKFRQKEIDCEN